MSNDLTEQQSRLELATAPERLIDRLMEQYEQNVWWLNKVHVLEFEPEKNAPGIRDEEGHFYPLPTAGQVKDLITKNWPMIELKLWNGFTQLQLTPMAMPVPRLLQSTDTVIRSYVAQKKLFYFGLGSTEREPVSLERFAVHVNQYLPINYSRDLIYFPTEFDQTQKRDLKKSDLIDQLNNSKTPGWSVCLIENIAPPSDSGEVLLEGGDHYGKRPFDFFDYFAKPPHENETGLTIEDYLTAFILQVCQTHQVDSNNLLGNGGWLLGNLSGDNLVMHAHWDVFYKRLEITAGAFQSKHYGCTGTVVRLT